MSMKQWMPGRYRRKKTEHEARLYTAFVGVRRFKTQYLNNVERTQRNAYSMKSEFVAKKKEENVYVNHIFLCLHE